MIDVDPLFENLKIHAFSEIGLADREKFHTGLLAHTLRQLQKNNTGLLETLIGKVWGDKAKNKCANSENLQVFVEHQSIDLIVKIDGNICLFAEVKLKTTLSENQLEKYSIRMPKAYGALLVLFTPKEVAKNVTVNSFPETIVDLFSGEDGGEFLKKNDDSIILIRLWVDYLKSINSLACQFAKLELKEVQSKDSFKKSLQDIKLKGIFEWYRYNVVLSKVLDAFENCKQCEFKTFNSNGNAGINFQFNSASGFSYGLQWQANALKLFVIDNNYKKGSETPKRDEFLHELGEKYGKKFNTNNKRMNRIGKFRSITVERWDVFSDVSGKPKELIERLKHLRPNP
jgi:PD-(D/E)XK nuclease superfamily